MADAEKSPQKTESMCALLDVTARIRHFLILFDVHPCKADARARARDDCYCFKKSSLASTCERGFGLLNATSVWRRARHHHPKLSQDNDKMRASHLFVSDTDMLSVSGGFGGGTFRRPPYCTRVLGITINRGTICQTGPR